MTAAIANLNLDMLDAAAVNNSIDSVNNLNNMDNLDSVNNTQSMATTAGVNDNDFTQILAKSLQNSTGIRDMNLLGILDSLDESHQDILEERGAAGASPKSLIELQKRVSQLDNSTQLISKAAGIMTRSIDTLTKMQ